MTPGFLVQRRHPARPGAVAPMLPQELLRKAPDHLFDWAQKPPGVFLNVGLGIGALLERNLILDDDAMMAVVGLAHDEDRHHQGMRLLHQPRERARGRRRLTEKRDEDRLAALGVLIERHPDQPTFAERLEHGARGRTLAHNIDAGALAHPGHQGVAGEKALRVMDERYLMTVKRMRRCQKLEIAEVRAEHDEAAPRIALFEFVPVMETFVADAPDETAMEKPRQTQPLGAAAAQVQVRGAYDTAA